mgnify:CR=1 FL=1
MKKLLLLTYYFPPGNFAGSYRMQAWAEHLHLYGYYPIVVTRHWEDNATDFTAISQQTHISREDKEAYTVYRLPFKGSIRDRLVKRDGAAGKLIGKFFSLFQVLGQNYFLHSVPYRSLYDFSRKLLKEQPDIQTVVTSGRPFLLFRFGYLLKKEFPKIAWLADYRDPWNSCPLIEQSLKQKWFRLLEKPLEKKWVAKADAIVTVSEGVASSLGRVLPGREVHVVTNGFEDFFKSPVHTHANRLTIAYIGSLYDSQHIEIFLEGFKGFIAHSKQPPEIVLEFLGLGNNARQNSRVKRTMAGFERFYMIIPWLLKKDLMLKAASAHLLLLCGMPERKGTYTAKFFDYLSLQKNIVLCPSDKDVLEKTIQETCAGRVLHTPEEVCEFLQEVYAHWLDHKSIPYNGKQEALLTFTHKNQVERLSHILSSIHHR